MEISIKNIRIIKDALDTRIDMLSRTNPENTDIVMCERLRDDIEALLLNQ